MADEQKEKPQKILKEGVLKNPKKDGKSQGEQRITHSQRKRPPLASKSETDIFVTSRSNFQSNLKKIQKLFDEGATEVNVHGLGRAVTQAVNLALQVKDKLSQSVVLSVTTDTVELQDEWDPIVDEVLPFVSSRFNSAVHINISRVQGFPATK